MHTPCIFVEKLKTITKIRFIVTLSTLKLSLFQLLPITEILMFPFLQDKYVMNSELFERNILVPQSNGSVKRM